MPLIIVRNDITKMPVDAIVNAAKESLLGGGGVDGCIHRAAGPELLAECRRLGGCKTGDAKITKAYLLPCRYVIHTVGPVVGMRLTEELKQDLRNCYVSCLEAAADQGLRSIAFCCISTGEFHFPNDKGAEIAVDTVTKFMKQRETVFDRIVFNVFKDGDRELYEKLLS